MATVYMLRNRINGKVYIGRTKQNPEKRWAKGHGYRPTTLIKNDIGRAILKHGWDNFDKIILEDDLTVEEAKKKELEYTLLYKSSHSKYGYNSGMGDGDLAKENFKNRATRNSRTYFQYDLNHNLIKIWESSFVLKQHYNLPGIYACCSGKNKTAYGYIWSTKPLSVPLTEENKRLIELQQQLITLEETIASLKRENEALKHLLPIDDTANPTYKYNEVK